MAGKPVIALVGGSGMEEAFGPKTLGKTLETLGLEVLEVNAFAREELHAYGPFGLPEGRVVTAVCEQGTVLYMNRHGERHLNPPSNVNWKANVWALKRLGATHFWATTACGSLRDEIEPGTLLLADQFEDVHAQAQSWFTNGPAVHLPMAETTCMDQDHFLRSAAAAQDIHVVEGGSYINIMGPEFSTRSESMRWHLTYAGAVVGMSMAREAKLVRGAQLHGSWLCLVTDWDSWKGTAVDVEEVTGALPQLVAQAQGVFLAGIKGLLLDTPEQQWKCNCRTALNGAVQTPEKHLQRAHRDLLQVLKT